MVQIIENWSEIRGRVDSVTGAGDGLVDVSVRVTEAAPVPGFPNLLAGVPGQTITVSVPLEGSPPPQPGDELHCLVRKAGPDRYFARPGSSPGGLL